MRLTLMPSYTKDAGTALAFLLSALLCAASCSVEGSSIGSTAEENVSEDENDESQEGTSERSERGEGIEGAERVDDSGPSEVLPDFTVKIVASATEGNAPMDVDFSVELTTDDELDPSALSYAWSVGPHANYDVEEFQHSFYAPTSAKVELSVTYRAGDGQEVVATDSEQIRVLGCADLMFEQVSMAPPVEVGQGENVSFIQAKMLNEGDVIETPFEVWVVLSDDDILDLEEDHVVLKRSFEGMESGQFGAEGSVGAFWGLWDKDEVRKF